MKTRSILTLGIAAILALGAALPANAAPEPAPPAPTNSSPITANDLATINAYAAPIDAATSKGTFDYSLAITGGVPTTLATEWAQGYALGGGTITNLAAGITLPNALPDVKSCRGSNAIWTDWLGGHAKFSSCATRAYVTALQGGAAGTTVAAAIAAASTLTVGALMGIIPALMAYAAWSIDACSKNGTGIEMAFAGVVCWAQ